MCRASLNLPTAVRPAELAEIKFQSQTAHGGHCVQRCGPAGGYGHHDVFAKLWIDIAGGTVDMNDVWRDAAVGAVGGAVAGGVGGLLTQGANTARAAVSAGSTSFVARTASSVLGRTATRSALAAGVGGSASNVMEYSFDEERNQTFGGYVATAATGFVIVGGGSRVVGKIGSDLAGGVAARVPGWTTAVSRGAHAWQPRHAWQPLHSAQPFNWGSVATEQVVDRIGGSLVAVGNTSLKPGGPSYQEFVNATIQGFGSGASGPSSGHHAGGW